MIKVDQLESEEVEIIERIKICRDEKDDKFLEKVGGRKR